MYGTLLTGEENYDYFLKGKSKLIGEAEEKGFGMISLGGYPGAMERTGLSIKGEVFEVPDLKDMDRLEGCPNFYFRKDIEVEINGNPHKCWIYVYNIFSKDTISEHKVICSGSWREFLKRG